MSGRKQYHIIGAGLLNLAEVQAGMDVMAARGYRVISTVAVEGAVIWTMERDIAPGGIEPTCPAQPVPRVEQSSSP